MYNEHDNGCAFQISHSGQNRCILTLSRLDYFLGSQRCALRKARVNSRHRDKPLLYLAKRHSISLRIEILK